MALTATRRPSAPTQSRRPAVRSWILPAMSLAVFIVYNMRIRASVPALGNLRWLLLAVLAVVGLLMVWQVGSSLPLGPTHLGLAFFSLATFASVSYSIIPQLSLYKAIAFVLGMTALVFGLGLRYRRDPGAWLRLLAGANLGILALTALLLPFASSFDTGYLQGPFVNPNSLGSILVLTFPAVLWLRDRGRLGGAPAWQRALVMGAIAANLTFMSMSGSRASLVVLAMTLVLYSILRRGRLAAAVAVLIGLVALASPSVAGGAAREAIFKGSEGGLAFQGRVDQLRATFDAAAANPISGYGFGTAKGVTTWDGSLSSLSTGREKENAYVAAVEEVGLVGAVPLLFTVGAALMAGYRRSRRLGDATSAALLMVVAAGALHTNFEAWLMAMGSFEAFIFWASVGVMLAAAATTDPASRPVAVL